MRPEYDRGEDGFVAGSIVRIKTRNFMTYDNVEFYPGPRLNMIIGPNGTGKSSIAAAIAIGLGFPPTLMGRSKDLSEFVKQGLDEAETEIEIKGWRGKRNVIIWRRIYGGSKSEWRINGQSATATQVKEKVGSFCIQANNLCSFLPQDKVAEFAKMAPVVVLQETMRAAGDPRLTQWHAALVEKGAEAKEISENHERDVAKRDDLKMKLSRLEPMVALFQDRKEQEFRREVLKMVAVYAELREVTRAKKDMKKEVADLKQLLTAVQSKRQPLEALRTDQKEKADKAAVQVKKTEDDSKDLMRSHRQAKSRLDRIMEDESEIQTALNRHKLVVVRRQNEIQRFRQRMEEAQKLLNTPVDELQAEFDTKRQTKVRAAREQAQQHESDYLENDRWFAMTARTMDELSKKQQTLESIERQRENEARRFDPSIAFALDWLAQNGDKFEGKVHKPAMISVNVRDRAYAWQVEMCTNVSQRKTFICENQHDYRIMLGLNNTTMPARQNPDGSWSQPGKVQLHLAAVEVTEAAANPQRPCPPETLAKLGFEGWAIDFVEAAPAVAIFLMQNCNMHRAALTRRPANQIDSDKVLQTGITTWITKDDANRAIKSRYGKGAFQTTTTAPVPARAFNLAVDQDAVNKLVEEIARMKRETKDREGPHQQLRQKQQKANEVARKLSDDLVKSATPEMIMVSNSYEIYLTYVDRAKSSLENVEKQPSPEALFATQRAKLQELASGRLRPLGLLRDVGDKAVDLAESSVLAVLAQARTKANFAAIEDRYKTGDVEVDELRTLLGEADFQKMTAASSRIKAYLQESFRDLAQDVKEEILRQDTAGEIPSHEEARQNLAQVESDLAAAVNVDPREVEKYEKIRSDLEKTERSVELDQQSVAKIQRQINRILTEFDPALDTLVSVVNDKFSAAFARIGCAGEVRIDRVEGNFAAWGIQIMVSYRDGDALQILNAQVQSGGERSLATITYLMSLSDMARAPFSLVDEINQGMDQRAERNVHNQLVSVTCNSDAGQSFLITPKLLVGLSYHERMKILIVNNGAWLPDPLDKQQRFGSLKSCLTKYKRHHAAIAVT
ncbi:nucleus protein [Naematelia encephala]|uniref:Structural maintenance of chromosomes protein 5 n=1 Tax=Naematelia encephala TaxID=71784 RepID=A0A1Y2B9B4_9TREE|nr:nucleus protein [Naematelia encephala]